MKNILMVHQNMISLYISKCSFILFLKNKFNILHKLRCMACYVDTFIFCNMNTSVVILLTFHNYSPLMLSVFIRLCVTSLWLIYYLLQVCILKQPRSYPPHPHPLVTTILLCIFCEFDIFICHI